MKIIGAAFTCCILAPLACAQEPCPAGQEYDELVSTVTEQFFDRTFNGLDWDARVAHHRTRISCNDDERAVATVVNALLSELEASHTAVYTAADLDYWALNSLFSGNLDAYAINFPGIWPQRIGDSWYARFVFEDSPAQQAGVQPGDELTGIDGADFAPLGFREGRNVLTISTDGVTTQDIVLEVPRQSVMRAVVQASLASVDILQRGQATVGWFRLWAAHNAIQERFNTALAGFEEARVDALVIDLRGPYGGTSDQYLAGIRQSPHLMAIPKFFLIDDSSRSGKEWLAGLIAREGLGTLVGTTTAGAYLAGRRNLLAGDRYFLYVAVQEAPDTGIGPIEGVGVSPHVVVDGCRTYCAGRDSVLEKALELIN